VVKLDPSRAKDHFITTLYNDGGFPPLAASMRFIEDEGIAARKEACEILALWDPNDMCESTIKMIKRIESL